MAIAIENADSTGEYPSDGTVSLSFTANAGSNRVAIVVAGSDRTNKDTTCTITYGGASEDFAIAAYVTDGTFSCCKISGFKDTTIGSGAKTVQAVLGGTGSGGWQAFVAVLILSGVDQTTPVRTGVTEGNKAGANPSLTVASVVSGDVVVDGMVYYDQGSGDAFAVGANQTRQTIAVAGPSDTDQAGVVISTQAGSDGGVMSWTNTYGGEFSHGANAFIAAAGGVTHVPSNLASLGVGVAAT